MVVRSVVCVLLLVLCAASPSPMPSPDLARSRVDALLSSGRADPAWFSASFLAQVPAAQVDALVAQLASTLGGYVSVEGTGGDYTAHYAKGTDEVLIHLDGNRIDGLFFRPPKLRAASLDDALHALRPASGTLSYVVVQNGTETAALDAGDSEAVGSAFKLAVLAALRDQVAHGRRHWADVIALQRPWKSLPSGVLQKWPDGTPLTLATYAAEMISISDNTAADALIHLVGQSALAPYAARNQPFLTTREAFVLKSSPNAAQRAAYLQARSVSERAAVLRDVDAAPLPEVGTFGDAPNLAIEWHYSVRELCRLMRRVADLPVMSINPGVADTASFRHVAFKGGSDAGVLNLTTQVITKRGGTICFSATVNDAVKAIDERSFELAYRGVLAQLALL